MFINKDIKELEEKLCRRMDDNISIFAKLAGDKMPNYNKLEKTIISQQRTIEQLTKALCDKYERGLFIFSEDGKIPMVIRNGKELTNDMTTFFSIEWSPGEVPDIHIDQLAATYHDEEK